MSLQFEFLSKAGTGYTICQLFYTLTVSYICITDDYVFKITIFIANTTQFGSLPPTFGGLASSTRFSLALLKRLLVKWYNPSYISVTPFIFVW